MSDRSLPAAASYALPTFLRRCGQGLIRSWWAMNCGTAGDVPVAWHST